eukprot:TRINITY_DN63256_c0_g1_i1.p1 TRINITY_DN63256_c0_g1~~TRINITY_DN63256_c0_g1_i1.p1  ORF type:complete len:143 (-),score=7.12 TRINITY_DN63256_c0_g1_i1:140-568(-)
MIYPWERQVDYYPWEKGGPVETVNRFSPLPKLTTSGRAPQRPRQRPVFLSTSSSLSSLSERSSLNSLSPKSNASSSKSLSLEIFHARPQHVCGENMKGSNSMKCWRDWTDDTKAHPRNAWRGDWAPSKWTKIQMAPKNIRRD